ncbi:MAG: hypothetical protein ACTSVV_09800 [Promethearchaeota archaeon]
MMAKIDEILEILDRADNKTIEQIKKLSGEVFNLRNVLRDLKTKFQNEVTEIEQKIDNLIVQRSKLINTNGMAVFFLRF